MKKGRDYIGVGAGAVIMNDNDEILLLLRNKEPEAGCWSIPGGAIEFFETLEDAIVREVKEEVGVIAEVIDLLGVTNHIIPEEGLHWVTTPFLVKIKEGIPTNLEPQKHLDLRWFPVNNLPENITMTTRKALEGLTKWRMKNNFFNNSNETIKRLLKRLQIGFLIK